MGFPLQVVVGPQIAADGAIVSAAARQGRGSELIVAEDHGKYWDPLMRGSMYIATTLTAGIAIIVAATTGNHPTIWNPLGNVFNAGFAKLAVSFVSGTDAPGALYWMSTSPAGAAIATGGPIATFTNVPPVNALLGSPNRSTMQWAPSVCTFTAAPTFFAPIGITLYTGTVAAVVQPIELVFDYDEEMGVAPGAALSICSQANTTTALVALSLHYVEGHV